MFQTKEAHGFWPFGTAAASFDGFTPSYNDNFVIALSLPTPPKPKFKHFLPTTKVITLPGDEIPRIAGQCVNWVKYITGLNYPGNAKDWVQYINSDKPVVGSVVVLNVGKWGHIGVVVKVEGNTVTVRSRNWLGLYIVSDDEFDINDNRLTGYIVY